MVLNQAVPIRSQEVRAFVRDVLVIYCKAILLSDQLRALEFSSGNACAAGKHEYFGHNTTSQGKSNTHLHYLKIRMRKALDLSSLSIHVGHTSSNTEI